MPGTACQKGLSGGAASGNGYGGVCEASGSRSCRRCRDVRPPRGRCWCVGDEGVLQRHVRALLDLRSHHRRAAVRASRLSRACEEVSEAAAAQRRVPAPEPHRPRRGEAHDALTLHCPPLTKPRGSVSDAQPHPHIVRSPTPASTPLGIDALTGVLAAAAATRRLPRAKSCWAEPGPGEALRRPPGGGGPRRC